MLFYSPNFEKSLSVSKWAAKLEIEVWLLFLCIVVCKADIISRLENSGVRFSLLYGLSKIGVLQHFYTFGMNDICI